MLKKRLNPKWGASVSLLPPSPLLSLSPRPHRKCYFLQSRCTVTGGPFHMSHEEAEAGVPWDPADTPRASLGHP